MGKTEIKQKTQHGPISVVIGAALFAGSIGLLFIPILGWLLCFVSFPLAWSFMKDGLKGTWIYTGNCPYCGGENQASSAKTAHTCNHCKRIFRVEAGGFYTIG